ncbi:DUF932 domain-containing protein [Escherichia coli]|nr:DUF932 domain-containing protein [Escherichia coli]
MNPSDAIEAIEKPLSSLPYSLSRHILEHLRKLTSHEPVIGIMGKSGAGKSSLCNALFQGEVTPVSDVHAGTREVRRFRLSGHGHSMVITDLPGVGESRDRDAEYEALYRDILPELDLVLWLIKADDRALSVDEYFWRHILHRGHQQVLFVVTQADKTEPCHEWDMAGIQPSPAQAQNIREKTEAVFRLFRPVHPVVAVSARTGWELDTLVSALMTALPDHAASPLMTRLQDELRTESVRSQAREQFTGAVDRIFDTAESVCKHTSRSQNYTYIPTITVLESLQREGFQPFFACQTRVRDPGRRGYTKHMLRLRRAGEINGEHVPEIILLNSHDGTSSYQMLPGYFRFVCQNGCVCGQSLGEVRVPHRGNVVDRVIEGAYEVVGVFDRIEEKRDAMQSLILPPPARQALAQAALTYRYGDEHQPVTTADILTPRRREDYGKDLWSAYQTIQENMLKGGISGRSAKGKRIHTRAIHSIDTDIKLNRALWVMAETLLESLR